MRPPSPPGYAFGLEDFRIKFEMTTIPEEQYHNDQGNIVTLAPRWLLKVIDETTGGGAQTTLYKDVFNYPDSVRHFWASLIRNTALTCLDDSVKIDVLVVSDWARKLAQKAPLEDT